MATFECPICLEDVPESNTFCCGSSHRVCLDCFAQHIAVLLESHSRVLCPVQNCTYEVTPAQVRSLVSSLSSQNRLPARLPPDAADRYESYLLELAVAAIPGIVHCPTTNCENWVVVDDASVAQGISCEGCGATFCAKCKAVPYHYHCGCGEADDYRAKWVAWETSGRVKYNSDRADALEKLESQRAAIEARNEQARKKYEEKMASEKHFAEILRYCPKCGRPIEKVEGCDSMICGRNYHGGDVQDGCGASFDWKEARPYVPEHIAEPKREMLSLDVPEIAKTVIHRGVMCDGCHKEIRGLRFCCIHCPCCNFCQDCEAEFVSHHPKDHVFRIIDRPDIL